MNDQNPSRSGGGGTGVGGTGVAGTANWFCGAALAACSEAKSSALRQALKRARMEPGSIERVGLVLFLVNPHAANPLSRVSARPTLRTATSESL
jgi:hypothetical protein